MQSSAGSQSSQRSMPRRTPTLDQSPAAAAWHQPQQPPPPPAAGRQSSGSAKSPTSRRSNPSQQLSQIEKSVTHLLVATKQLLETLTQWSRHNATEAEVSDVYVRLGYEFNIASRAFNAIGVETADLGNVPDLLRTILEDTLSQEASPQSLDRYLPRIRDIIINLLHGLKRKQAKLRQRQNKDSNVSSGSLASSRKGSSGSFGSAETLPTDDSRPVSGPSDQYQKVRSTSSEKNNIDEAIPARKSSAPGGRASPARGENGLSGSHYRSQSGQTTDREPTSRPPLPSHSSTSSLSSSTMQALPVVAPYPQDDTMPDQGSHAVGPTTPNSFPHPPPPQPKQQDALTTLQQSGDLERRASRRYSAYHLSKHLGASPSGMPMLPPSQTTPVPNRGHDVRDSMSAVRSRGSVHGRQRSANRTGPEVSPTRQTGRPIKPTGQHAQTNGLANNKQSTEDRSAAASPIAKTPEDKLAAPFSDVNGEPAPKVSATINGPVPEPAPAEIPPIRGDSTKKPAPREMPHGQAITESGYTKTSTPAQETPQFIPEQSPAPGKELTLFLQYKSKIRKFVLPEGSNELSIGRLQLAFIEKFAWNTHSNGQDLPEIYVQDPVSGIRHELEDLNDVKDRSVLVLNVEALDEVKKHFDENFGGMRKMFDGIRTTLDSQQSNLLRVSERQQEAAKEIARLAAAPPAPAPAPAPNRKSQEVTDRKSSSESAKDVSKKTTTKKTSPSSTEASYSRSEIQTLRRDLAVLRQTYSGFVADVQASMGNVKSQANEVKDAAVTTTMPSLDSNSGRSYVNKGKTELTDTSDELVNKVDDLQDSVEELRKDVVLRGVRPLPRQLDSANRELSAATGELRKVKEFLSREKPKWNKVWQQELQVVCDDRDFLNMQEALAADLQDDLDGAAQTFALVEEATKEQLKDGQTSAPRNVSRGLTSINVDPSADPRETKENVLGEVRALQPNHEDRLEAIARAEKARQKELESRRGGAFQKELGSFVGEGRLKKSGGVEEAERLRKAKDDQIRREVWERQNARAMGLDPDMMAQQADGTEDTTEEQAEAEAEVEEALENSEEQARHGADRDVELADEDGPDRSSRGSDSRRSWLPSFLSSPKS